MEHNYIDIEADSKIQSTIIHQANNNLDNLDNLNDLPSEPAVYAVCGRVNGKPVNPRLVGVTEDLQRAIKEHFEESEDITDEQKCFKEFMLSIKTKQLIYEIIDLNNVNPEEVKEAWTKKYDPKCNSELNEVH